ncbi:MAG: hypothetical protein JRI25_23780 [Deltaproteobacteria bacterium]|nr:hypothetical protein [Deltaproteobacteria bacterium]
MIAALTLATAVLATGSMAPRLGEEIEVVVPARAHGLTYFPDAHITLLRREPDVRMLLVAGTSTHLLTGPDMLSLSPIAQVLAPGEPGAFDNGYAGIFGVFRSPTSDALLALYHAEDQEQMPKFGNGVPGYFASIGMAVSADDGLTFERRGPVITGSLPKSAEGRADQGVGEGSLLVDASGEYLYCYYSDHSRVDRRGVQICLARCPIGDAGKPGAWRKYFDGEFAEPGLGGRDTPLMPRAPVVGDTFIPHVVYVEGIRRYIMTFCRVHYADLAAWEPTESGIWMAVSDDGIHYGDPVQLLACIPLPRQGDELSWHPSFVIDSVSSDGLSGYLYYAFSESWGWADPDKPHYLVRRSLTVSLP